MNSAMTQPVLRCAQCNKPFDKASTLKRHGYYCRIRKNGLPTTRRRSCLQCAKRKSRCDSRPTGCSSCVATGLECQYPAPKAKQQHSLNHQDGSTSPEQILPQVNEQVPFEVQDLNNNTVDIPDIDLDFATFDAFNDIFTSQDMLQQLQNSPEMTSPTKIGTRGGRQLTIPPPLLLSQPRSLVRRSESGKPHGNKRITHLIFHTFKSYPLMFQLNTFPPFIHPQMLNLGEAVEPLENCMTLLQMMSSNRKLFWKNVEMETQRFCEQYLTFSKWELLTSLQSLSLYILIRIGEGETLHNNLDNLLLMAVTLIAQGLASLDIQNSALSSFSFHDKSWSEWIFEESTRRLCVFYQIVNMLVEFQPADQCKQQSRLVLSRLPARKDLWEAENEESWRLVGRREEVDGSKAFGMDEKGELVRLNAIGNRVAGQYGGDWTRLGSDAGWEEWCSGMDSFGGLVMLAASLVS